MDSGFAGTSMSFVLLDEVNDLEIFGDCSGGGKNLYNKKRLSPYTVIFVNPSSTKDKNATESDQQREMKPGMQDIVLVFLPGVIEGGELLGFGGWC